jgi:hypothetical protein
MLSRRFVAFLLLSPLTGCAQFWHPNVNRETGPTYVGAGPATGLAAETVVCDDQIGDTSTQCAPACPPKPCCPPQPKVIRIKVVQPKAEGEVKQAPALKQPQAFSAPPEVMLVPRTVFVPFVAQTPTGPARVLSLQGAVPLVAPPSEQGAPQPQMQGPAPEKKEEKKECAPPPCKFEVSTSCPQDLGELNQRLDRVECLLRQLCAPPCPPPSLCPN